MTFMKGNFQKFASVCIVALAAGTAQAADKPLAGITLNLASMNDQFSAVLAQIAPEFKEATGAEIKVDIMDYGSLLTKTTADFVGHTAGYDLITMDIVWAGQFAANGYTIDLSDLMKRDAKELDAADIYPKLTEALGNYKGKQVAYPFAGYANVLAYRKDLFDAAGLKAPETMEDTVAAAYKLTDPAKKQYGFVANGQKGPAVAQDWMQYNAEMGGAILDKDGKPALNSEANIKSLTVYRDLFKKAAPPGAADYDWGGREESFRQGIAATMQTGPSARPAITIRRRRRWSARSISRLPRAARVYRRSTESAAGAWPSTPMRRTSRKKPPDLHQVGHKPEDPEGDEHARRG